MVLHHTLSIIILLSLLPISKLERTNDPRFNYLLFEHFEWTKTSFLEEQDMVKMLKRLLIDLRLAEKSINNSNSNALWHCKTSCLRHYLFKDFHVSHIKKNISIVKAFLTLKKHRLISHNARHQPSNFLNGIDIMAIDILNGASKGIVTLQETYDINITQFSKGNVYTEETIDKCFRKVDGLQPDDLVNIASIAFVVFKWYTSALSFLLEAISAFNAALPNGGSGIQLKIKAQLLELLSGYNDYHNLIMGKDNSSNTDLGARFSFDSKQGLHKLH